MLTIRDLLLPELMETDQDKISATTPTKPPVSSVLQVLTPQEKDLPLVNHVQSLAILIVMVVPSVLHVLETLTPDLPEPQVTRNVSAHAQQVLCQTETKPPQEVLVSHAQLEPDTIPQPEDVKLAQQEPTRTWRHNSNARLVKTPQLSVQECAPSAKTLLTPMETLEKCAPHLQLMD